MLVVLSPSKTLDWKSPVLTHQASSPLFPKETQELVELLRGYSQRDLQDLMDISGSIAQLNFERFRDFYDYKKREERQAIFAFKGDSYLHFDLRNYSEKDFEYLQDHLRIFSGLYGCLRPLDAIVPYRLEMGTALPNSKGKNLYVFWEELIRKEIQTTIAQHNSPFIVNLASEEYFKAFGSKNHNIKIIQPVFKDYKKGSFKNIAIFAKKARSAMADYIIQNRIESPDDIQAFDWEGYHFAKKESTKDKFLFLRKKEH